MEYRVEKGKLGMKYIEPAMEAMELEIESIVTVSIGDSDTLIDFVDGSEEF